MAAEVSGQCLWVKNTVKKWLTSDIQVNNFFISNIHTPVLITFTGEFNQVTRWRLERKKYKQAKKNEYIWEIILIQVLNKMKCCRIFVSAQYLFGQQSLFAIIYCVQLCLTKQQTVVKPWQVCVSGPPFTVVDGSYSPQVEFLSMVS